LREIQHNIPKSWKKNIEMKKKKHGVIVKEGGRFDKKIIYNQGYKLYQYDFIPKKIHFKSPMVNDFNQHLSGGWFMAEIPTYNDVRKHILQRVINRKKPLGVIYCKSLEKTKQLCKNAKSRGLFCEYKERDDDYQVIICQKGTLNDLFDLESLKKDYAYFEEVVQDIEVKKNKKLSDYKNAWDVDEGVELWETGLILGYPIENTLSLYNGELNSEKNLKLNKNI